MVVLGSAMVAAGAVAIALALTGAGNDWLGGHLIRCGGRYMRRPCAPGEIPWRVVWQGLVVAVLGIAMLVGAAERGGTLRVVLGTARRRTAPSKEAALPASVPPPAPGTTSAPPADSAGGPARRTASVGPPGAGSGGV